MYKDEEFWADRGTVAPASAPSGTSAGKSRLVRRVLREPLLHFVLFGLLIFAVAHWLEARSQRYVISIGPGDVTRIENSYIQQYGAAPDPAQMRTMIDNTIREEIYLREGLALGLDKNDEIVRRRIAQKYQFLQADMAVPRVPSEADLHAWFDAHRAQFAEAPRRSFDQRYFAIDQRGEAAATQLAAQALTALQHGGPGAAGDEFPGPKVVARLGQDDVQRIFGGADFAQDIFSARPGQWVGPIRSGFGWHLIRVTEAIPGRPRDFADAHDDALIAWQQQDRDSRNNADFQRLLARYTVDRADRR